MDGWGSGTWTRTNKKMTVESCPAILSIYRLARDGVLRNGASGTLVWKSWLTGHTLATLEYAIISDGFEHVFRVVYPWGSDKIAFGIRLRTTQPHFGGKRWWFTCPIIASGVPCGRRVAKLYLAGPYFGCRQCHDLTYDKCQQSKRRRQFEKMLLSRHLGNS